jgi:hypothetical protein
LTDGQAIDHREAQPGALAKRLGRKNGPKSARSSPGHADARVGRGERDILSGRQIAFRLHFRQASIIVSIVKRPPSGIASLALMQIEEGVLRRF